MIQTNQLLLCSNWPELGGAVVRALASHQCGPGSNLGVNAICELSLLFRGWKGNHESWIIVTKHVRIMNFCFKNLRIINLCTSARESWITRLWEKLNKIHVWINCVRSREYRSWRFRGELRSRTPLYNSCIQGWQSACFSNNLVLSFQYQKTPCQDKTNDDTKSEWSRSLNTKEYKTRLKCP